MSDTECYPKADFFRKPNFLRFPNCGFNTRHDNREVTLIEFFENRIFSKAEIVWIFTECSEVWIEHTTWWSWSDTYSFGTSANFALWQMRHRFNPRKRINDYQRYSMLTVLPLRSMSCTLGNSSSLQAAGDDHSCRYYNSLSTQKDILKNFLCIWWWQMLWWKHVFTRK